MISSPCPTPFELSQMFLAPSGDPQRKHLDVCQSCAQLARLSAMAQQLSSELPSREQREATRTALLSRSAPAPALPRGLWVMAASGLFLLVISALFLLSSPGRLKPSENVKVLVKAPEPQDPRPKERVVTQPPTLKQKRVLVEYLSRIELAAYRNQLFSFVAETFSLDIEKPTSAPTTPKESRPKEKPTEPAKETPKESGAPTANEYETALQEAATALRNGDLTLSAERFGYAAAHSKDSGLAADALFSQARVLMRANRKEEATQCLQEFLRRFPESPRNEQVKVLLDGLR
jgi:hypothetical protein